MRSHAADRSTDFTSTDGPVPFTKTVSVRLREWLMSVSYRDRRHWPVRPFGLIARRHAAEATTYEGDTLAIVRTEPPPASAVRSPPSCRGASARS